MLAFMVQDIYPKKALVIHFSFNIPLWLDQKQRNELKIDSVNEKIALYKPGLLKKQYKL